MKTFKFAETSFFYTTRIFQIFGLHRRDWSRYETTGLNFSRDRLCLIQIGISKNECHLIKFEKSEFQKEKKYKNLFSLLENKKVKKFSLCKI